ncbi:hypothetical protein AB0B97_14910 [Micromonospora sp. NPDC049004]|uniref:hypothetical protein n=1 Tax=Micromonospora sp. NPDC049004 TaxID=3154348 RepID=UPI0033E1D7E9
MTALLAPPSWRLAWAERENERRRRAYRDATAAWRRRGDHLVRLRIEAAGFLGCTRPRTGLPVDLDVDELVFRVVPVAELVEAEARHVAGLPTPGGCAFTETTDAVLPPGLRTVDSGLAVVTSHRVAFAGQRHRREWRYADLLGAAHHPGVPVTLLHDHGRLSGLLVPASAAVNFRFYLTLAAASAAGDRAAVTAQLDALLAAHQASPPVPPPTVGPADAPLTAVRPDRRVLAVAAVATVVFAALGPGAVGPQQAGPMRRAEAATVEPAARNTGVLAPLRVPAVLVAPPALVPPARPAEPARPPAAEPLRPAAPVPSAVAAAAPVPATAPQSSTAPRPSTEPPPSIEPPPSSVPTPSSAPEPSASAMTPTDPPTAARPGPASPSPTTTPDPALLTVCLDTLLPLVDRLLCPPTGP